MSNVMKEVVGYMLFKKVEIINANAISSPLTYGLPPINAFLGAFHAMSRKMADVVELRAYNFGGVLLACHECKPQIYRDKSYNNYTFNQSRNPIKKDGKTASIIEEGKCHLTMTFVVEILGEDLMSEATTATLIKQASCWIQQIRIAGGSVIPFTEKQIIEFINHHDIAEIVPKLMPAFVLMDAQKEFADIIAELQKTNPSSNALDAFIDVATLHHVPENIYADGNANADTNWQTTSVKTGRGWLVPMPIGYQGISTTFDAGEMQNVRNPEYQSQYVEAIYGLGKWVYPHRISNDLEQAFWRYKYDAKNCLYLVTQTNEQ